VYFSIVVHLIWTLAAECALRYVFCKLYCMVSLFASADTVRSALEKSNILHWTNYTGQRVYTSAASPRTPYIHRKGGAQELKGMLYVHIFSGQQRA
jgi:hypothetical protein